MFQVNDDLSIYVTRGDMVFLRITADKDGEPYTFQPGELVRFKVFAKKDCKDVVLEKDFPVTAVTQGVDIILTGDDTKIGDVISKPRDLWYEVELNPLDNPMTIIGYDEDGAKVFKLFPEGADIPQSAPDPRIMRAIDTELDMTSERPVQNQVIARAFANLQGGFQAVHDAVAALHVTPEMFGAVGDGKADDTRAFETAVASLKDNSTFLLRGKYLVAQIHMANIENLTITGGGTLLTGDTHDFHFVDIKNCNGLTIHNIHVNCQNKPCRAFNLYNTSNFRISSVFIENVGNDTINNSIYGIYLNNCHFGRIEDVKIKYVHALRVACGISMEGDGTNLDTVSTHIEIDHAHIEDVAPIDDADGVKVLGRGVEANLTVSNSVFKNCRKRALKFQARKCYSVNNYIETNYGMYAPIDFQEGYGNSVDDHIHFDLPSISGNSGYSYIGIAVSHFTNVRGLRVTVANNDPALYSGASSSSLFLVQRANENDTTIGKITIKDCHVDGCAVVVRNTSDIPCEEIVVDGFVLDKIYKNSFFYEGEYQTIVAKNLMLRNVPTQWFGFCNGVTVGKEDIDLTGFVTSTAFNAKERPGNIQSRVVLRAASETFASGSYVYENGRIVFTTPVDGNPQGNIYGSGKNFAIARTGDMCYLVSPVSTDEGLRVGWICTANPDTTYTRGQWKEIYM